MSRTAKLLANAKRQGFRRGVMGASRAWTGIWAGAALASFIRKRLKGPEVIERYSLKPGQTIIIQDLAISEVDEKKAMKQEQQQAKASRRRK